MFLTIFTAPKPFTNPHIARIQRNAIRSWKALGSEVEVILIGDEAGIPQAAQDLDVYHVPEVSRNSYGTPLIGSIFNIARREGAGQLLAYVNADILLQPDLLEGAEQVKRKFEKFLIVGQRWDLDIQEDLDFSGGWNASLLEALKSQSRLHPAGGSDYFIFPRTCFNSLPGMAVGRAGWDNWMIYHGRRHGWPVVDATADIQVVHQSHDYSHLPDGQPHYRLPETDENVRLGGGKLTIFKLADASYVLKGGRIRRAPLTFARFWREVEIFPLIHLHMRWLAWTFFTLFHPVKGLRELRRGMGERINHRGHRVHREE
jgi:hypothetical protein